MLCNQEEQRTTGIEVFSMIADWLWTNSAHYHLTNLRSVTEQREAVASALHWHGRNVTSLEGNALEDPAFDKSFLWALSR